MQYAVLGIDAAWSKANPSGVALVRQVQGGSWKYVAAAPSYGSFIALAEGKDVNWEATPAGGLPDLCRLLNAAAKLLKDAKLTVVAVDIPVSHKPIVRRRRCDNAISNAFGKAQCGTHSPNENRPGTLSAKLKAALDCLGYNLVTQPPDSSGNAAQRRATIEVYPHPAIVRLLNLERRLEYKVDKSKKFWPCQSLLERREMLRANFQKLHKGLSTEIAGIPEDLIPTNAYLHSRRSLKRYEDALDALVCAWVGACYLEGRAEPFSDADAAIWVPTQDHRSHKRAQRLRSGFVA